MNLIREGGFSDGRTDSGAIRGGEKQLFASIGLPY
jgi:hypothetical protein